MKLIEPSDFQFRFPRAWAYLTTYEKVLRAREKNKMNTPNWYAYNYPKNLDKQDKQKLLVPRLVQDLSCSFDYEGKLFLDNVDVGGVTAASKVDPYFLLAAMNGPVANFGFRRISKPFQNGYWSANKQFIAPLPIPRADAKAQKAVGARAKDLQERWTRRRDLLTDAAARLSVLGRAKNTTRWLWPDLPEHDALLADTPKKLHKKERSDLADKRFDELEEARIELLQGVLNAGGQLSASFDGGELKLLSGGAVVLDKIFLDAPEGKLAVAYWQYFVLSKSQRDAASFSAHLRRVPLGPETPAARQFITKVAALVAETEAIRIKEREMNEVLYGLYNLSSNERILIEKDCAMRPVL
jgi:hypothetical protein